MSDAWWWPEVADDAYIAQLRSDYPESGMSDGELLDYYADGLRYPHLWDHVGDAADQWQKAAAWMIDARELIRDIANERRVYADEARALLARIDGENDEA